MCTQGLNLYRCLITYLSPVVPRLAEDSGKLLGCAHLADACAQAPGRRHDRRFKPLIQRVDKDKVAAMVEASKPPADEAAPERREGRKGQNVQEQGRSASARRLHLV